MKCYARALFPLVIWTMGAFEVTANAATINVPPSPAPNSLAAGDVLNLLSGGSVPQHFTAAAGSLINIDGGTLDTRFGSVGIHADVNVLNGLFTPEYMYGKLNVYGGTVGELTDFRSETNVYGGMIGNHAIITGVINFYGGSAGPAMFVGGTVNVFGGALEGIYPYFGGTINMYGGKMPGISLMGPGTFNLYGGHLNSSEIFATSDSHVSVFGSSFLLDGTPIPSLSIGNPVVIKDHNGVLTGVLMDGSNFIGKIRAENNGPLQSTKITVYLVPEPTTAVLLGFAIVSSSIRQRRFRH